MIDVIPIDNRNIRATLINIPAHISRIVEFITVLAIRGIIRSTSQASINVHAVSDEEIKKLNLQYRGEDKVTNVLSFPCDALDPEIDGPREFGDLYLCMQYIENEADSLNILPINHLAHMLIHGVLHLAGYDHETDEDFEKMKTKEIHLLGKIRVPNPYKEEFTPIDLETELKAIEKVEVEEQIQE